MIKIRYRLATAVALFLSAAEGAMAPQWTSVGASIGWGTFAGVKELDGVSGATRAGGGASVHCNWPAFGGRFLTN
jgi:hypothetical protein